MTEQKQDTAPRASQAAPDVSVVIVNYNGLCFMAECLDGLKSGGFTRYSHEVIVIDNASSDGSQDYLRGRGDIHYIESKLNLGFTGGNNRAAAEARGRVLLLLNNDTRIDGPLDALVDQALQPGVGAVGPRLAYGDGRLQLSVGFDHTPLRIVLSWLGLQGMQRLPAEFRRMQTDPAFYETSHERVDWVSGAVLATPTPVWRRLNGLDDNFFMYCEDVDYCRRVAQMGLRVAYTADVKVTHYEGAGKAWIGGMAVARTSRSYFEFVTKHFGVQAAKRMAVALSSLFFARSLACGFFGVLAMFKPARSALWRDKGKGYFNAAGLLLRAGLRGGMAERI